MNDLTNSSRDILKSTSIIGGSKVFAILISIVQVKIIAILLGPGGVGSISLFNSVIAIITAVTSFGISFSAVRNISVAVAAEKEDQISRIIIIVKRWVIFSGILGFSLMAVFSDRISFWTFGDESKSLELSILSVSLLFISVAGGQSAILRGYRKIKELAKINIYGAAFGFIISVPIYYFYRTDGIVPVLVFMNLSTLLLSFYYSNKIKIKSINVSVSESFNEGLDFVKLGFFTVLTGVFMAGTMYYIRILITEQFGVDEVGYFAAASALSITYLDVLLQALGTDYFPRLSAVHNENSKLNSLVNEQTFITILIGAPLILIMLTFSNIIIAILYSSEFSAASGLLMWMILGVFFRLILWPIGFVFLAKASGKIFVFTQAIWNIAFLVLAYFGVPIFGLEAIGMSFCLAYLITFLINITIFKYVNRFSYDKKLLRLILIMMSLVVGTFVSGNILESYLKYVITILLMIMGVTIAINQVNEISSFKKLLHKILRKK